MSREIRLHTVSHSPGRRLPRHPPVAGSAADQAEPRLRRGPGSRRLRAASGSRLHRAVARGRSCPQCWLHRRGYGRGCRDHIGPGSPGRIASSWSSQVQGRRSQLHLEPVRHGRVPDRGPAGRTRSAGGAGRRPAGRRSRHLCRLARPAGSAGRLGGTVRRRPPWRPARPARARAPARARHGRRPWCARPASRAPRRGRHPGPARSAAGSARW